VCGRRACASRSRWSACAASAAPGQGAGTSGQRLGHVNVTLGANGGITRLGLQFNLRCSRGKRLRGPLTETWAEAPLQLVAANGVWTFAVRYTDTAGDHYALTGTFPTVSSATGTLSIVMLGRRCSTGLVHWSASLPS
jgi:hypothetical protein